MNKQKPVSDYLRLSRFASLDAALRYANLLLEAELASIQQHVGTPAEKEALRCRVRALVLREMADSRTRGALLRRSIRVAKQVMPTGRTSAGRRKSPVRLLA